jgi:hypothetical protein
LELELSLLFFVFRDLRAAEEALSPAVGETLSAEGDGSSDRFRPHCWLSGCCDAAVRDDVEFGKACEVAAATGKPLLVVVDDHTRFLLLPLCFFDVLLFCLGGVWILFS